MRKGFTLIELLAVIVILAIIALIATPIILNIINDSKEEADVRSAENYLDAVELAIARKNMNSEFNPTSCQVQEDGNLVCDTGNINVSVDGQKPTGGKITFDKGKVNKVNNLIYNNNVISTNENGKLVLGLEIELKYNTLVTGQNFNSKIKTLAGALANITSITFLGEGKLPDGYTKATLQALTSTDVSLNDDDSIMAYSDGNGNIYVYSEDRIAGNADSSYMFAGCSNLITTNLSDLITSNITNMDYMFVQCSSLTTLNINEWNTSNVLSMSYMFNGCANLNSLNLSEWNTSNVTNMEGMFVNCSGLTSIYLNGWDTSSVTNMKGMFNNTGFSALDLSHFNTSNVISMVGMFSGCTNLESLDLSGFDTRKVNMISQMFVFCSNLTSLNLSGWIMSNKIKFNDTGLSSSSKLQTINLTNVDTTNMTDMSNMFAGCSSLTALDLSSFDTTNVTNMSRMFGGLTNLTCVKVGQKWDTNGVTVTDMFLDSGISSTTTSDCPVTSS